MLLPEKSDKDWYYYNKISTQTLSPPRQAGSLRKFTGFPKL